MPHDTQRETRETDGDYARLRADLSTIRQAAGLEPPFGRKDIWANLAVAAGGAVGLVWALLPTGLPAQWGAVPLILIVVGYLIWMRSNYARGSGRSPARRREYTSEIVGMVVVGALALVYRFWAQELQISTTIAGGAVLFVFGLSMLVPILRDRNRIPDLGFAVPFIVCGLLIPLCEISPWAILGAMFLIGGLATAALIVHLLRDVTVGHATD